MDVPKRYPAGELTYQGDCTETLPNQMMGPTYYGTYVVCDSAEYDKDSNTTRAKFLHCLPNDMQHMYRTPSGFAYLDEEDHASATS